MKIDEILKLVNAGYSKDEIALFETDNTVKTDTAVKTPDVKNDIESDATKKDSFDYEKFAEALVKAQQIANGKQNFGGQSSADLSKFF